MNAYITKSIEEEALASGLLKLYAGHTSRTVEERLSGIAFYGNEKHPEKIKGIDTEVLYEKAIPMESGKGWWSGGTIAAVEQYYINTIEKVAHILSGFGNEVLVLNMNDCYGISLGERNKDDLNKDYDSKIVLEIIEGLNYGQ